MKNLSLKSLFSTFIIFSILSFVPGHINAQELDGIGISPAIQSVDPGNTYEFTVHNFTQNDLNLKITPVAIEYILTDEGFREAVLKNTENINFTQYLEILNPDISIPAKSEQIVSVKYLSKLNKAVIGLKISIINSIDSEALGVGTETVGVMVDYNLSETDILGVESMVKARIKSQIVGLANNGEFKLTSNLANQSTGFIQPSGQIEIFDGETRLGIISLTQDFPNTIYPEEEVEIESLFVDDRSILEQLGKVKFVQTITVDGREIVSETAIFIVPFQIIIILAALILITLIFAFIFNKRRSKGFLGRKKVQPGIFSLHKNSLRSILLISMMLSYIFFIVEVKAQPATQNGQVGVDAFVPCELNISVRPEKRSLSPNLGIRGSNPNRQTTLTLQIYRGLARVAQINGNSNSQGLITNDPCNPNGNNDASIGSLQYDFYIQGLSHLRRKYTKTISINNFEATINLIGDNTDTNQTSRVNFYNAFDNIADYEASSQDLFAGEISSVYDNIINSLDFSVLSSKYRTNDVKSDLNQDGVVNALDLSILSTNFWKGGDLLPGQNWSSAALKFMQSRSDIINEN